MEAHSGEPKQNRAAQVSCSCQSSSRQVCKTNGKLKKNENDERRASGIQGVDHDEDGVYRGLTDIHNRIEDAKLIWETANDKKKREAEEEKKKAEDMRKKATESLSETKKRKEAEGCEPTLKRRGQSSQALALVEGVKIRRESAQAQE